MTIYGTLTCIHYIFVSKCKSVTGFVLVVHGLERPQHVEGKILAASAAWSSHFHVLRSFQSMHPSHSSGNYYMSWFELNSLNSSFKSRTFFLQCYDKYTHLMPMQSGKYHKNAYAFRKKQEKYETFSRIKSMRDWCKHSDSLLKRKMKFINNRPASIKKSLNVVRMAFWLSPDLPIIISPRG